MSYPYRVKVKDSVVTVVSDCDSTTQTIALEQILTEPEMADLMKQALKERGFKEKGGVLEKKHQSGEVEVFDPSTMEVKTTLTLEEQVKLTEQTEVRANRDDDRMSSKEKSDFEKKAKEDFRKKLETKVQKKAENIKSGMAGKIATQLEKSKEKRTQTLREAIMEVYAQALKTKAASMGTVDTIEESGDGDEYELTISISE